MIGIIADDLTGAGDAGLHFAGCGLDTVIHVDQYVQEAEGGPDAIIINTNSRFDDAEIAAAKVRAACAALKELGAEKIFKKIDSTLRGNIGAEIDALFDEFEIDALPFCAAFPAMGRTTVEGVHYVNGIPVSDTELADDPRNPVEESHIPTMLERQSENRQWVVVFNAGDSADLKKAAREIEESGLSVVVGAAGLAGEMAQLWSGSKCNDSDMARGQKPKKPVLVVSGSRNNVTYKQLEELKHFEDVMLIPIDFSDNTVRISNWKHEQNTPASVEGKSMVIFPAKESEQVSPEEVMKPLSALAGRMCGSGFFSNIVLAGGETAFNVCKKLDIKALKIKNRVLPGIAFCRDSGDRYNIILKPGGFGDKNALVDCIKSFNL